MSMTYTWKMKEIKVMDETNSDGKVLKDAVVQTLWEKTGKDDDGKYFDLKVLKGDINIFLESDEDLSKMSLKISYFETCINYIENILKMINNRGFQVKNAIDAKRFEFPV